MSFSANAMRGASPHRGIVDHRLARRMLINQVRVGRVGRTEVCDAHPELLRAAENVGTVTGSDCPVCEEEKLRIVTYIFGYRLPSSGRCVSSAADIRKYSSAKMGGDVTAYVVEACIACRWHHLLRAIPV